MPKSSIARRNRRRSPGLLFQPNSHSICTTDAADKDFADNGIDTGPMLAIFRDLHSMVETPNVWRRQAGRTAASRQAAVRLGVQAACARGSASVTEEMGLCAEQC